MKLLKLSCIESLCCAIIYNFSLRNFHELASSCLAHFAQKHARESEDFILITEPAPLSPTHESERNRCVYTPLHFRSLRIAAKRKLDTMGIVIAAIRERKRSPYRNTLPAGVKVYLTCTLLPSGNTRYLIPTSLADLTSVSSIDVVDPPGRRANTARRTK